MSGVHKAHYIVIQVNKLTYLRIKLSLLLLLVCKLGSDPEVDGSLSFELDVRDVDAQI